MKKKKKRKERERERERKGSQISRQIPRKTWYGEAQENKVQLNEEGVHRAMPKVWMRTEEESLVGPQGGCGSRVSGGLMTGAGKGGLKEE